jgi:diacylglycerol kinase (ATP)
MPPLFIVNPEAGNGTGARAINAIRRAFAGEADVECTEVPGDARRIAEKAGSEGSMAGPVVAVGGDGTVMEVVDGLMRCVDPPRLGIVPVGNGNDLARTLGIPRDPVSATRLVWSGVSDAIDVGRCNDQYFLNVGGAGLDTKVVLAMHRANSRLMQGRAGYLLQGVGQLLRFTNPEFEIILDDEVITARSLLVAVANGRYYAGGMRICPGADVTDGLFDVCVAGDLSRQEALMLIPLIYAGRHLGHPKVRVYQSSRVQINRPDGAAVQLDGEVVDSLPADFSICPRALRVAGWAADRSRDSR